MSSKQLGFVLVMVTAVCVLGGAVQTADVRASGGSSLSGYVFVDQNFNGIREPMLEWVLPDIEILLSKAGDPSPIVTLTDETGLYEFTDLGPGTYTITQPVIPGGYLSVKLGLGRLVDAATDQPLDPGRYGHVVNYDQLHGIPPQFADIELTADPARGTDYGFGQLWTGKAWYLTGDFSVLPPHARPPIPEPAAGVLLAIGAVLLGSWTARGRRG